MANFQTEREKEHQVQMIEIIGKIYIRPNDMNGIIRVGSTPSLFTYSPRDVSIVCFITTHCLVPGNGLSERMNRHHSCRVKAAC